MKGHISSTLLAFGFSCAAALTVAGSIRAQAPPGPLPGTPPEASQPSTGSPPNQQTRAETRTSIFGQWKLNRDESDDPRKKMEDARGNNGGGRPGGGGVRIGGFPIGGHSGNRGGESDEDRQRMQSAIAPANSLTLKQKNANDPEIDLTDDQNRKRALFTDGRKLQKPDANDDSYQETAAHWDGSRLVTDEKSPRGGKMSRTFELSYDGTQLFETLRLAAGRSNAPLDVRYVYDAFSSSATPPNQ
jgi:hypothetical protein